MKYNFLIPALLLMLCISFCKKQGTTPSQEQFSECLEAKFEAFKQLPYAESIVKIQRPLDTLYWLKIIYADGGEEVLNKNCELVCTADCECDGSVIVLCDETYLNFPMETIWEQ